MARMIKCADALYKKHKAMIYDLIRKYEKDGFAAFDELESLSNEVFTRCFHKWDPSRAQFSTLLYRALSNAFRTELGKGETRLRNQGQVEYLRGRTTQPESSDEWLRDFIGAVDSDARQIVAKLFRQEANKSPEHVYARETRKEMKEVMLALPGWTQERVQRAFKDIRVALRTQ